MAAVRACTINHRPDAALHLKPLTAGQPRPRHRRPVTGQATELTRHTGSQAPAPGTSTGHQASQGFWHTRTREPPRGARTSQRAPQAPSPGERAPPGQRRIPRGGRPQEAMRPGRGWGSRPESRPEMLTFGEVLQPERRNGCSLGSQLLHERGHGPPAGCPGGRPQQRPSVLAPRAGGRHRGQEMEPGGAEPGGVEREQLQGEGEGVACPLQGNLLPDHFVEALPVLGRGALLTGHREQSAGHSLIVKLRHRDRHPSPRGPGPRNQVLTRRRSSGGSQGRTQASSPPQSPRQTLWATRGSERAPGAAPASLCDYALRQPRQSRQKEHASHSF